MAHIALAGPGMPQAVHAGVVAMGETSPPGACDAWTISQSVVFRWPACVAVSSFEQAVSCWLSVGIGHCLLSPCRLASMLASYAVALPSAAVHRHHSLMDLCNYHI